MRPKTTKNHFNYENVWDINNGAMWYAPEPAGYMLIKSVIIAYIINVINMPYI